MKDKDDILYKKYNKSVQQFIMISLPCLISLDSMLMNELSLKTGVSSLAKWHWDRYWNINIIYKVGSG